MEKRIEGGLVWYRADHITMLARKTFTFRMIGKILYMRPKHV